METRAQIGEAVRRRRKRRGLSIRALARLAQVSKSVVGEIENDGRYSYESAESVAVALGVKLSSLLREVGA